MSQATPRVCALELAGVKIGIGMGITARIHNDTLGKRVSQANHLVCALALACVKIGIGMRIARGNTEG